MSVYYQNLRSKFYAILLQLLRILQHLTLHLWNIGSRMLSDESCANCITSMTACMHRNFLQVTKQLCVSTFKISSQYFRMKTAKGKSVLFPAKNKNTCNSYPFRNELCILHIPHLKYEIIFTYCKQPLNKVKAPNKSRILMTLTRNTQCFSIS